MTTRISLNLLVHNADGGGGGINHYELVDLKIFKLSFLQMLRFNF